MSPLRCRALALPVLALLMATTVPTAVHGASTPSPSPPSAGVSQAQQQLQQAKRNAAAEDTALGAAQQQLAESQARLTQVEQEIATLDQQIAAGEARLAALQAQAAQDKLALAVFLRETYEGTLHTSLAYIIAADNFNTAIQREITASNISDAGSQLVDRITTEEAAAQTALDAVDTQRAQMVTAQQQAATTTALVEVEREKLQAADYAAHVAVTASQQGLAQAQAQYNAEQAALLADRAKQGLLFPPIAGVTFTVDTDLTLPSRETAARLNTFLNGTALQGLGGAYMAAGAQYHVSARYLLAHSIEESAFGTSAIAVMKHNLFGYGADDANPFADAVTFPSFAACINAVAADVAANYLSPSGPFFHGPTLRGMNVDYATDPNWAANIAEIADSFP